MKPNSIKMIQYFRIFQVLAEINKFWWKGYRRGFGKHLSHDFASNISPKNSQWNPSHHSDSCNRWPIRTPVYSCISPITQGNSHEQLVIDVELKLKRPLYIVEVKMTHAQADMDKSFPPSAPQGKNRISIQTGRGTSSYFRLVPWPLPHTGPRKKPHFEPTIVD